MVYWRAVLGQFQHVLLEHRDFGALFDRTSGTVLGRMKGKQRGTKGKTIHQSGESGDEKLIHGHFLTLFSVSQ